MWLLLIFMGSVNAQCYWNNRSPYVYFGTKTPYDHVRGDFRDVPEVKGCEIISVWFMTRHGVRHPNADDAAVMKEASALKDEILESYAEGRGEMCAQDIADFRDWIWDDELDNSTSKLTTEGYQELLGYGKRFGEKFASFIEGLDESLIRSTSEIRTRKSRKAFMEGLEGINHTIFVDEPIINDVVARESEFEPGHTTQTGRQTEVTSQKTLVELITPEDASISKRNVRRLSGDMLELCPVSGSLSYGRCALLAALYECGCGVVDWFGVSWVRPVHSPGDTRRVFVFDAEYSKPYRYCKRRGDEVIFSSLATTEVSRYQETREFRQLQANVQRRSGLTTILLPYTIMGLYDLCRFYRSYTIVKRSPWCALFSDHELEILEYVEDIRHYIRNGYGHPMNLQLGAAGLKDLYEKFNKAYKTGTKILTGYFSHDTMIDMIYSAMGLFHDYPEITSFERNVNRKWRTSFLTPFVANFVAVLHRCPRSSYRIQFFINEKEVHLCGDRLCMWEDFKTKFEQFADANLDFCDETMIEYNIVNN